jgi:cyclophilin family peptidyl-prolyl cis-trans isomerase
MGTRRGTRRDLASGSGAKVNKDPLSLLRLGLPAIPKDLREAQVKMEEAQTDAGKNLPVTAIQALNDAKGKVNRGAKAMVAAAPDQAKAQALVDKLKGQLEAEGSLSNLDPALGTVTELQELIASGKPQPAPPAEFTARLPYLKGRATVEWVLKRPDGQFDVEGTLYKELKLTTVLDGYTAPVTAGNMLELVNKGFYNNFKIQRSDGFVVQTGDPKVEGRSEKNGYVPPGETEVRKVPLEVFVSGDKAPIYGTTFDDDGRGGYAAALPFNAYGALGLAREEYDPDSASTQFFWLLFDSDLTPAGKNLLDGRYTCFGYTVDGAKLLSDVKEGDLIVSAKVTSGLQNLVKPG